MSRARWILAVLLAMASMPVHADVESDLRSELVGRYALSRGALASECTDLFTDMKVVGGRLSGGAGARFEAGELVKIDNVNVGAISGLDVNLTLVEPFLLGFRWEVIEHLQAPNPPNAAKVCSLRLSQRIRAVGYRDGEILRLVSLHPDLDSAYQR